MIGFWQGTKEAARTIPASCLVFSRNCSVIRLVCFTQWNKKYTSAIIPSVLLLGIKSPTNDHQPMKKFCSFCKFCRAPQASTTKISLRLIRLLDS
jgi:hypothetical protein